MVTALLIIACVLLLIITGLSLAIWYRVSTDADSIMDDLPVIDSDPPAVPPMTASGLGGSRSR